MIKASELMQGNKLQDLNGNKFEVKEILEKYVETTISTNGYFRYDEIEPIPLSEEILLKCGFEIQSNAGVKYISFGRINKSKQIYLPIVNNILSLSIWQNKMFTDLGTRIKYLHQLQNLYFALTGHPLTITI